MDFSNPMVLANAMIFHDTMMTQMSQSLNSYPSSIDSYHPPHYQLNSENLVYPRVYNGRYYSGIEPIENTLKSPLTLEDLSSGSIYFKAILGVSEDSSALFVSTLFNSPKVSQIASIKAVLSDKIAENISVKIKTIYIVVTGVFSSEVKREFIRKVKGEVIDIENSFIIKKERL